MLFSILTLQFARAHEYLVPSCPLEISNEEEALDVSAAYIYYKTVRKESALSYCTQERFEEYLKIYEYVLYTMFRFFDLSQSKYKETFVKKGSNIETMLLSDLTNIELTNYYLIDGNTSDSLKLYYLEDKQVDRFMCSVFYNIILEFLFTNSNYEKYLGLDSKLFYFQLEEEHVRFSCNNQPLENVNQYINSIGEVCNFMDQLYNNDVCQKELLEIEEEFESERLLLRNLICFDVLLAIDELKSYNNLMRVLNRISEKLLHKN